MLMCFVSEICVRWTVNAFDSRFGIFISDKFGVTSATFSYCFFLSSHPQHAHRAAEYLDDHPADVHLPVSRVQGQHADSLDGHHRLLHHVRQLHLHVRCQDANRRHDRRYNDLGGLRLRVSQLRLHHQRTCEGEK